MIIGIDNSPLTTGHRFRGTGAYTKNLTEALEKYESNNTYKLFTRGDLLPKNIDLVHYPYFDPFFLTLPLRKPFPTIVTVHDIIPIIFSNKFPRGLRGEIKWLIQRYSLKGVQAIITDSECSKNDLIRVAKIDEKKIFVVHLAVGEKFGVISDQNYLTKTLTKYNLPKEFVLYVGDATWNKNVPGLIRAVQKINVPLVMVGKQLANKDFDQSNPWNKDLLEISKLIKDDKQIYNLGFVPDDDLISLYNLATVYAHPAFYEGFGLPVLEAMACGCPVITSKVSSLPEVAGEAAFYVNPKNIADISDGIRKLFSDRKLKEEFRNKGILQAQKFSWEKTVKQTVTVYKQVLKQPLI